jgi:transposase
MNKHSKGDTWRIRQSGLGGGFRVRSARPQYRVVQLPRLSPEAAYRYKVVLYANRRSVEEASLAFGNPISTIYRWRARFNPRDLSSLEPKSRRPKRTRRQQWTAAQEQAVLDLRRAFPGCGKQPLAVRLARQGVILSPSTVGRILASLKRRQLLVLQCRSSGNALPGANGSVRVTCGVGLLHCCIDHVTEDMPIFSFFAKDRLGDAARRVNEDVLTVLSPRFHDLSGYCEIDRWNGRAGCRSRRHTTLFTG